MSLKSRAEGEIVFCVKGGGPLHNWDRETKAIQAESNTEGWTRHDLRRTGATMLGDLGELPDIVEAALNHTSIARRDIQSKPLSAASSHSLQRLAEELDAIEMAEINGKQSDLRKLKSAMANRADGGPNS
jgi:integrase